MSQLTPLPEPFLEDVDHELWGQNAKCDCYSKGQMLAYGKAEYERGLEDAAGAAWWHYVDTCKKLGVSTVTKERWSASSAIIALKDK